MNVGTLEALLRLKDDLSPTLAVVIRNVDQFADRVGKIGSDLLPLSAGLAAVGIGAGKMAIDFESSFAGVRKTVDASEEEFGALAASFRNMAKEIPVSVNELNRIAEAGGQLGVAKEDILGFTRTMADMGEATNLSSDQAAEGLAQLANIINNEAGPQYDRLGATIVDLGNKGASTESQILDFGLRLAGAGKVAGMSEPEILGMGSALASVGINAEAGGTAFSKVIIDIASASAKGGSELEGFASVAGMSAEKFRQAFQENASGAVVSFVEGLGRIDKSGGDLFGTLESLNITETRMRDALLRSAGAGDLLRSSIETGTKAWKDNNALTIEAEKRYATMASQLKTLWNQIQDVGISLGQALMPALKSVVEMVRSAVPYLESAVKWFAALPVPVKTAAIGLVAFVAALGPALYALGQMLPAITALGKAATLLGGYVAPLLKLLGGGAGLTGVAVLAGAAIGTTLGSALVDAGDKARGINDPIKEATKNVGLLRGSWILLGDAARGVGSLFASFYEWNKKLAAGFLGILPASDSALASIVKWSTPVGYLKVAWDQLADAASKLSDGFFKIGQAMYGGAGGARGFTDEEKKLIDSAKITSALIAANAVSLKGLGAAHDAAGSAAGKHTALTKEQQKAIESHGKAVSELRDQLLGGGKDYQVFADAVASPAVMAALLGNEKALKAAGEQAQKFADEGKALTPNMQALADKAFLLGDGLKAAQQAMAQMRFDALKKDMADLEKSWESIFGTAKSTEAIRAATDELLVLEKTLEDSGKTIDQMSQQELEKLNGQLMTLYSKLKDSGQGAEDLEEMLGQTSAALRGFGVGVEAGLDPCKKLAVEAKKLAEALQKAADASVAGHIAHAFDEGSKAIYGIEQAMDALGVSADNSFRQMVEGLHQVDAGAEQFAKGGLTDMIAGLAQMATGFMKSIDSASTFQRALGGLMAGAKIGKQIGMLAGPMGAAWGAVIGGLIGMTIGIFHKPAWAKVGDEAGKMLGTAIGGGLSKTLSKAIADQAKKLGLSLHDAILLNLGKIADETGAKMADMSDTILELLIKVGNGTLPVKEGVEAIGEALDKLTDEALGGSADAIGDFIQITGNLFQMIHDGTIPAQQGIDMLTDAFNKLKGAAEEGNKAASDMMFAMIMQARAAGVEIAAISEYVKSELQKSREALEHMPPIVTAEDAISQANIFSATFWGSVAELGLVAAATAFIPAWNAIKKSLEDAGIDRSVVESILGGISPVMRLVSDSVTGPIVQGIDALNQSLEGLSNSGYMTTAAFEGFEQQAQAMYDRLIAAGVAPEVAFQAIAPLLQNIQDVAARYGMQIDANTQGLIDQAAATGIAFSTDPQQQMIDALNQIVVLLGGTVPAAATTAANSIVVGAQGAAAAYRAYGDSAVDDNSRIVQSTEETTTTMVAAWGDSLGAIADFSKQTVQVVKQDFDGLADRAGEDGDYVGVVWAQNIDEIALHVGKSIDPVAEAFEQLADGAVAPANKIADAVDGIVDGLKEIPKAAQKAGEAMNNMPNPGGGGGGGPYNTPPGGGPHAAYGAVVAPTPGGVPYTVGEGGSTEVIAPVAAILREMGAGLAAGLAGAGGGGTIENRLIVDGRELAGVVSQQTRRRQLRVNPNGLRPF